MIFCSLKELFVVHPSRTSMRLTPRKCIVWRLDDNGPLFANFARSRSAIERQGFFICQPFHANLGLKAVKKKV